MPSARTFWRSTPVIIVAGCLIAAIGFGPRSTMGFFLTPMTTDNGWSRETFALAIAIQNLVWGAAQPFVGMIADKFGTARVLTGGALLYALGLALMSETTDPLALQLTAGVLIGLGIAGSAFLLVLAAFARLLPDHMRTLAYGLGTAAGSAGQFVFAPLGQAFIHDYGWQTALLIMAASRSSSLSSRSSSAASRRRFRWAAARPTRASSRRSAKPSATAPISSWSPASSSAVSRSRFITVHLPPYLSDIGIPATYGGIALALIGGFNIVGSISSGVLSGRMPKRILLSALYFARSVVIVLFVLTPPSVVSVLLFASAMGLLWLSTVPPTQQLVAIFFGTRYMATLFGFVFFSHQVGSFLGVWLGGRIYDATGSYDGVWWISVALGIFAAIVHLPIRETRVLRPAMA